jgi:hypothetical protein
MFRDPDEASKKRSRKAGCPSCPRNEASTASVRKRNYRRAVNLGNKSLLTLRIVFSRRCLGIGAPGKIQAVRLV